MTAAAHAAPGIHAVQFYEREPFLHRAIAAYFAEPLRSGETLVMIARRHTFEAVAERLAAVHDLSLDAAASRIMFVDVDSALRELMDGVMPDPVRFEQIFSALLATGRGSGEDRMVWIYGEMVDVLCKAGNYPAAARLEELGNAMLARQRVSIVCGYAIDGFDDDVHANRFRTVCRQHTHISPTERFTDAPDDRTRLEQVALLQQRTRALDRILARESPASAAVGPTITTATVYVIDDDASVRQSLARLLVAVDLNVRTFASAEAFLAEVDRTSGGCLIVDMQLVGMSGPELQIRLAAADWPLPVIAMSGSDNVESEMEALRLGARAFLRKPFDAQALIDAIARALS